MSKLSANAQPFVPATTPAATSNAAATRYLIANPQPIMVLAAPVQHHAGIWWMTVPLDAFDFEEEDDDDDLTGERSLFMTFSNGSPLTKEEITAYFNRRFGLCVETVYVKNEKHRDPEYGKVTFLPFFLAEKILRNRNVVKISVNKKPIWLKKYVPRSQRRMMAEGNLV